MDEYFEKNHAEHVSMCHMEKGEGSQSTNLSGTQGGVGKTRNDKTQKRNRKPSP